MANRAIADRHRAAERKRRQPPDHFVPRVTGASLPDLEGTLTRWWGGVPIELSGQLRSDLFGSVSLASDRPCRIRVRVLPSTLSVTPTSHSTRTEPNASGIGSVHVAAPVSLHLVPSSSALRATAVISSSAAKSVARRRTPVRHLGRDLRASASLIDGRSVRGELQLQR